jgi:hypothetical protein
MKVRSRYHDKYGPIIMLISPLANFSISLGDAVAVADMVNRPKAFPKLLESYSTFISSCYTCLCQAPPSVGRINNLIVWQHIKRFGDPITGGDYKESS